MLNYEFFFPTMKRDLQKEYEKCAIFVSHNSDDLFSEWSIYVYGKLQM